MKINESLTHVFANTILVASADGPYIVTALDRDTGQVVWRSQPKPGQKPIKCMHVTQDGQLCISAGTLLYACKVLVSYPHNIERIILTFYCAKVLF